jgi:hypothetical protein
MQQQQQLAMCFVMLTWPTAAALHRIHATVWVQLETAAGAHTAAAATMGEGHFASSNRHPAAAAQVGQPLQHSGPKPQRQQKDPNAQPQQQQQQQQQQKGSGTHQQQQHMDAGSQQQQ